LTGMTRILVINPNAAAVITMALGAVLLAGV
jgi:hypothetical protein